MKKTLIRLVALIIILIGGFLGYQIMTAPDLSDVPPVPPKSSAVTTDGTTETANAELPAGGSDSVVDVAALDDEPVRLLIEMGGSTSGVIEIELFSDVAPGHVARIKALAEAGKYDNVVFHRVIDGFMAQTGDVEFGRHGSDTSRAGMGGSSMPDLKAEFSAKKFNTGVVGMARSQGPDSANSQFFIMFGAAPYLNGQYTIVGRVVAGQDVVNAIKKGSKSQNGAVVNPDFMKTVRLKSNS